MGELNLRDAALRYAADGWPVLPLIPGKRSPLIDGGYKSATTDAAQIREWWRREPLANIGAATGGAFFVVDLDRHNGKADGVEAWKTLRNGSGEVPTLTARTPNNGFHLFYRLPEGMEVGRLIEQVAPGIDILGSGGYVVLTPSKTEAGTYSVLRENAIVEAPEWLLEAIRNASKGTNGNAPQAADSDAPEEWKRFIADTLRANPATLESGGELKIRCLNPGHEDKHPSAAWNPEKGTGFCFVCGTGWSCKQAAELIGVRLPELENAGLRSVSNEKKETPVEAEEPDNQTWSEKVVALASEAELFHDPKGEGYATFRVNGADQTAAIRSRAFSDFLRHCSFTKYSRTPPSQALQDARDLLRARARFDGREREVHLRLAGDARTVYVDLCNESWQVVEITAGGWEVKAANEVPVRFRRTQGMKALPVPERGGNLNELSEHLRFADEDGRILFTAFLIAALRPGRPYPILNIGGEQGSAKTTATRIAQALIDPSHVPTRTRPREERDLAVAAANRWILPFDNLSLSAMQVWLSDALCRISTGGGFGTRQLYSDDEEKLFYDLRPVIVNGIDDLITRGDLADRAVSIRLEPIPEAHRKTEAQVWDAFDLALPRLLGALYDGVVSALGAVNSVRLERLPRMADFALWATAAEAAYCEPGAFMAAYSKNRAAGSEAAVEHDTVASAIVAMLDAEGSWTGKASTLVDKLKQYLPDPAKPTRDYPASYQAMAGHLRRIMPALRDVGIERSDDPRERNRGFTLSKIKA